MMSPLTRFHCILFIYFFTFARSVRFGFTCVFASDFTFRSICHTLYANGYFFIAEVRQANNLPDKDWLPLPKAV